VRDIRREFCLTGDFFDSVNAIRFAADATERTSLHPRFLIF
jgi:hypothetical protein